MPFENLHSYLLRLSREEGKDAKLWVDEQNRVQGQFFNCALTSLFYPVRNLEGAIQGFDAHAHSYSKEDRGLSIWSMLNGAASDDESIELDRLCRIVHVLNFFRQAEDDHRTLIISVHERLLASVTNDHGAVFRHILDSLELPVDQIILQLPRSGLNQPWMVSFVVANYRRNGFRVATRASGTDEVAQQLEQLRPDMIRIDIHSVGSVERLADVIEHANALGTALLFSRVDRALDLQILANALELSGTALSDGLWITGSMAGRPEVSLESSEKIFATQEDQITPQQHPIANYT